VDHIQGNPKPEFRKPNEIRKPKIRKAPTADHPDFMDIFSDARSWK